MNVGEKRWQPRPGEPDQQSITCAPYGGKAGIWRILHILDRLGVPATFCANARSVEFYPAAAAQVVRCGRDLAAHGYTQGQHLADIAPEQEQATVRHCIVVPEGDCDDISNPRRFFFPGQHARSRVTRTTPAVTSRLQPCRKR